MIFVSEHKTLVQVSLRSAHPVMTPFEGIIFQVQFGDFKNVFENDVLNMNLPGPHELVL